MPTTSLRLHHRIVLPFAAVVVLASSVGAWITLSVASSANQARVEAQVVNTATLVARSDFALNPAILRSVQAITGDDVVTFTADGSVLASTLDPARRPLTMTVMQAALADSPLNDSPRDRSLLRTSCAGIPCVIAVRPLSARAGASVAIVALTSDLTTAPRAVTRTILATTVGGALLMVVASQALARRVTAPLDALVTFASSISDDAMAGRAPAGPHEIGRLAAAFNAMLDRLEHSRRALVRSEKLALAGLIAARVAHDIRNPLSSIRIRTQLLRASLEPAPGSPTAETIDAILHDTAHVESIVRDLLEVARPSELVRRPTRLNDVVGDVLREMAPQLAHRKVTVATELDPRVPEALLDGARLRQVLVNLVNNASDAMPGGGALLVTTGWNRSASTIALDVCDDGVGIDPEVRDRLFDPFVSTKRDGVGLGLVNAKAVVASHGGTIALEPRSPRGTRAAISLPAAVEAHG